MPFMMWWPLHSLQNPHCKLDSPGRAADRTRIGDNGLVAARHTKKEACD